MRIVSSSSTIKFIIILLPIETENVYLEKLDRGIYNKKNLRDEMVKVYGYAGRKLTLTSLSMQHNKIFRLKMRDEINSLPKGLRLDDGVHHMSLS